MRWIYQKMMEMTRYLLRHFGNPLSLSIRGGLDHPLSRLSIQQPSTRLRETLRKTVKKCHVRFIGNQGLEKSASQFNFNF